MCLKYFGGEKCDHEFYELVVIKTVISVSSIIAIVTIGLLFICIVILDIFYRKVVKINKSYLIKIRSRYRRRYRFKLEQQEKKILKSQKPVIFKPYYKN